VSRRSRINVERRSVTLGFLDGVPVSIVHTESDEEIRVRQMKAADVKVTPEQFESHGRGCQTRINAVLRAFKEAAF
jgi:hypothetical protein